jgi:hypothetical protein
MPLGYDVKEEATEIKEDLRGSRNNLILLLLGSVIGGVIVRVIVPKAVTEGSIFNRLKSWFGYDQEEEYEEEEE